MPTVRLLVILSMSLCGCGTNALNMDIADEYKFCKDHGLDAVQMDTGHVMCKVPNAK